MTRAPTEMELRVLAEISEFHSGDSKEGTKIVRAAIRAMRKPTTEMKDAAHPEYGALLPYFAWQAMIDVASPPEEK